ncbi:MAG: DNA repair protein RecN [Rhodospirillaceae bacterium]|nr:DNA repair protein RecN [Rhodospirillaceae bacterium]MBT5299507.1 DNA repair protein RecN [Rhodospirillaceae bacterium]MBT5513544.1 DNA repair protein RecN [Rhodospirillaceae bacterium]MBT6087763.1 DNA repair protein RecN [Rhodospirillaceae bacterium]MBT6607467.1 DNA repair protein RecN [Rhodospirillaceae bacterium]
MLASLSIRDVVLIDRLDLEFHDGLGVLTGETGAGKSILLDALGLAIGMRAEARLVRQGAERSNVSAVFEISDDHEIRRQLSEQGVETEGEPLILRRVLNADGRSRAFINDQAVSVGLLREIGDKMVEIHGQFESQRLLRPESHRQLLDAFGGHRADVDDTAQTFERWRDAETQWKVACEEAEAARRDEDFLRHAVKEMEELKPQPGEEAQLAEKRTIMMHGEKLSEALGGASEKLSGSEGGEAQLQSALRSLENVADKADGRLSGVIATLEGALNEIAEGMGQLDRLSSDLLIDPAELELAEERLFALRALARKHGTEVEGLAVLHAKFTAQLTSVDDGAQHIAELAAKMDTTRAAYERAADRLQAQRQKSAASLDKRISQEFSGLRLGNARFETSLESMNEAEWGQHGKDRVAFLVATNPEQPAGPIHKIASGGEMARFMLALKVVLAEADPVPTLIFDEVDAGIGGAVAAAVGERLSDLGEACQALVVTHSPQVAARGTHHWRVSKSEPANDEADGRVWTTVEALDAAARKEEIARMLAGAKITDEARAAADSLLAGGEG